MKLQTRLLSAVLALVLIVGLFPLSAFAGNLDGLDSVVTDPDSKNPNPDDVLDAEDLDKDKVEDPDKDEVEDLDKDKVEDLDKDKVEDLDKDEAEDLDKDKVEDLDKDEVEDPDKDKAEDLDKDKAPITDAENLISLLNDELKDGAYIDDMCYDTIGEAIAAATENNTILIRGTVLWDDRAERNMYSTYWTKGKAIKIRGADENAMIEFSSTRDGEAKYDREDDQANYQLYINGDLDIDDVVFHIADYNASFFYANGNTLHIGSNVTRLDGSNWLWVYGGAKKETVASTNLILEGYSYSYVFGGGREGAVTGDVNVEIGSKASAGSLFGGGVKGAVGGDITISTATGSYVSDLYGGAYRADVTGNVNITVNGSAYSVDGGSYLGAVGKNITITTGKESKIQSLLGGACNKAQSGLFTAGSHGADVMVDSSDDFSIDYATMRVEGDTNITVNGYASGLFGGGYNSDVAGNTKITLNGTANTVQGGGMGTKNDTGNVLGDTDITINGEVVYQFISSVYVSGAVYGSSLMGGYVGGNTNITISESGSAYTVLGSGDNGYVKGASYVTVNGTINKLDNDAYKDRELRYSGSVFGGGYIDDLELGKQAMVEGGTHVTIGKTAVLNNVYGGGCYGNVASTNVVVNTTVPGNIFAGGSNPSPGGQDKTGIVFGNTSVALNGDAKANKVYGGGNYADVHGDATVILTENSTATEIHGGSFGVAPTYADMKTDIPTIVKGTATITLKDNAAAETIYGYDLYKEGKTVQGVSSVLFNENGTSEAPNNTLVKIENADQVTVTNNSHVALDIPEDYTQLVNVKNLTVDNGAVLSMVSSNHILGNYTGTQEDKPGTLNMAAGSKLMADGTATGKTTLAITETPNAAALHQVYVVALGGSQEGAFAYTDAKYRFELKQNSTVFDEANPNANLTADELQEITGKELTETADKWWLVTSTITPPGPDPDPGPGPGGDDTTYYTVTVRYVDETNNSIRSPYTSRLESGSAYDVSAQTAIEISGYAIDRVEGNTSGTLRSSVEVVVHYVVDTTIIDPDTPTGDRPDGSGGGNNNGGNGDDVVIIDPDVPLGNLPNTGAAVASTLPNLAIAITAGCAAVVLGRKKEDDQE